ncbi:unannotated protein [freshwater metagenome]|uniref:Unannotated protein n=1 Tax=freshwater metagenome TaxID=449393 RepID=A0A6J7IB41_9ZZZZ|nr:hypothetical protein [Actinomycetota bacterium]
MSPRAPLVLGVLVALLLALAGQGAVAAAQTTTTVTTTVTSGQAPAAGSPLQTVSRAGSTDPNGVEYAPSATTPPAGHRLSAREASRIARQDPKGQRVRRENPGSYHRVFMKGQTRWQMSIYAKGEPLTEIGQVIVDDASGRVTESWDVPYVAWTMARGYDGAFGRTITNPYLWGVLLVLFLLPFVSLRPLRGPPVPILLLAGFSAPLAFFNNARLDWAVPLSFGLLASLFLWSTVRALRRPRAAPRPLLLLVPTSILLVVGLGLLVFRIVLNVEDGNVIDVGYASVVGADKIGSGVPVYTPFPSNVGRGDTYGPLTYLAYVPFEQLWPWSGKWDDLPAAHAAAIGLDALAAAVLFLVGRSQETVRALGNRRGTLYAYLWLACPFTAYCLNSNSNDALPAVALGLLLLVGARPFARGLAAGAAGAAKIAPFAILPVLATGRRVPSTVPVHHAPPAFWPARAADGTREPFGPRFGRGTVSGLLVLLGAGLLVLLVSFVALRGLNFPHLLDRTVGYQAGRPAPFMPWGFPDYDLPGWVRDAVRWVAVAFAVLVAFVPRRHDVTGTAAIVMAVILGLQMATEYWFYLYLVWLVPLVIAAAVGDRPLRWPGPPADGHPGVVPRMHGPVPEEDAPWAADVRRQEAARASTPGDAG